MIYYTILQYCILDQLNAIRDFLLLQHLKIKKMTFPINKTGNHCAYDSLVLSGVKTHC